MLAANEILIADGYYAFVGEQRTFHSMSELANLQLSRQAEEPVGKKFLPGSFIFVDREKKKHHERLETPSGMTLRLLKLGVV